MTRSGTIKLFRKLHKWPSVIIAFFAILFATSGIIMNHRGTFSKVDISRNLLPWNYRYKNWNMAAVRGSITLNGDSSLIYGNIGIWLTIDDFETFNDFNQGFPSGIDNRKIYSLKRFNDTLLVAGTHFGLFKRSPVKNGWVKISFGNQKERIADLGLKNDTLLILTRDFLFKTTDLNHFKKVQLPPYKGYVREAGLFNTLWELHSGELFGLAGKLFVDLFGLVVVLLSVTGLIHFFFPKLIRRRKDKKLPVAQMQSFKKKNLRWHNVIGYLFVLFLLINTTAGMFLRPPLLIPIANIRVGIIPFTHLDTPNPWHDKLRRVCWDDHLKRFIFSTADGFFTTNESLTEAMEPCILQPPVSLMGCNILERFNNRFYLIGSFSGVFLWDINDGIVLDYFTEQPWVRPAGMAKPVAENMAAGLVQTKKRGNFWFDYNIGVLPLPSSGNFAESVSNIEFPEMSRQIIQNSPMSLWNVALEFHTGRIFEHLVGMFYILYIPIAGLCILMVLVSGFFVWWMVYRKK